MLRLLIQRFVVVIAAIALVLPVAPPGAQVAAAPPSASAFVQLEPTRIMDTRVGLGVSAGARQPESVTVLQIAGTNGVPQDARAVVVNVTLANSLRSGYVQVYPTGGGTPGESSTLNVPSSGVTRANLAIVPLGTAGDISFYTTAGGHLIADVMGYFVESGAATAGRFVGLDAPARTLDTRDSRLVPVANPGDVVNCDDFASWNAANEWFWLHRRHGDPAQLDSDGDDVPCQSLPGNPGVAAQPPNLYKLGVESTYKLPVHTDAEPAGGVVPAEASAVVVNVTAVQGANPGFLQLYASASGAVKEAHSNLNFVPDESAPNLAIVPIGPDGAIEIFTKSSVHVIADVIGYFTGTGSVASEAGLYVPFAPERLVDSQLLGDPLPPETLHTIDVTSLAGLEADDVGAMFLNVTLANSINPGYLQVFPAGQGTPGSTSTVNVNASGSTRANAAITALVDGHVDVYTFAGGRVVLDSAGYFTSGNHGTQPPPTDPPGEPPGDPNDPPDNPPDDPTDPPDNPGPPSGIDVWYGARQIFGRKGVPQPQVNILGNAADDDGVASLTYSLNDGPMRSLTLGPDDRRLENDGDFNIELDSADLDIGSNSVVARLTDTLMNTTMEYVEVIWWPQAASLPYTANWSTASSVTDVSQVVDGKWELQGSRARTSEVGYDRLLTVGDIGWSAYEVKVPVTLYSIGPGAGEPKSGEPLFGFGLNWNGHSDTGTQPDYGFYPIGAYAWYRTTNGGRLNLLGNNGSQSSRHSMTLDFGTQYIFKARVEPAGGGTRYRFKVWASGQPEPTWTNDITESAGSGPTSGSIAVIAHHFDAAIGNIVVTPLN